VTRASIRPSQQSAEALAVPAVPRARAAETAGAVRAALVGEAFDCADEVAVVEAGRLVGLVPIARLLSAPPDVVIHEIMDRDPPIVSPGSDQEQVAWKMVLRGESAVAVVDAAGRFTGLIPSHRLVGALLGEHDEDVARLGGYLSRANRARLAAEEPLARRLWHRLPWLVVGLAGAMLSAVFVGAFERDLQTHVLLAVFMPAVVYLADAVGTQTETLLIRGLAAGVDMRVVARREAATGVILGGALAAVFVPFVWVVWDEGQIALAVSLALLAACSIATIVAMLLPWALQRAGQDPAYGSGPLATVAQDLLSILTYFGVASLLVT
jgi:magnesium transporter